MIRRNQVYTAVRDALVREFPDITVKSEVVYSSSAFPCAYIVEVDTYPELSATALDFSDVQRNSVFEVQVYSNKSMTEANDMIVVTADAFRNMYYRMTLCQPIQNADANIKRYVARFERIIGGDDEL